MALFCMTVFGVAEVIGGYASGRLIQIIGKKMSLYVLLVISICSVTFSLFANSYEIYGLWFLAAFFIGLWDSLS